LSIVQRPSAAAAAASRSAGISTSNSPSGKSAKVIAACDSSRKLRVWSALRLAVTARRAQRRRREDVNLNRHADLNDAFRWTGEGNAEVNAPLTPDRRQSPANGQR
jgi:hypothetical protein